MNGKIKCLGYDHDEKEAARIYDEQAALLGKPVNFPLHEGMEQAAKPAPKGTGPKRKCRAKSSRNNEEDEMEELDSDTALTDDDDKIDNAINMI